MLPTSGYFRSINCPFFDSGLCERPHCHFRHAKKDPSVNNLLRSNSVEDGSSYNANKEDKPDLLKLVTEAVRKIEQEVNQNSDFVKTKVPETKPAQAALPASNKYIEVLQENSDSEICSTSSGKKPASNVLEYKPTPIAQLKKMHENKYMQTSSKRLLDDLVYDPVSNFSATNKKIKLSSYEALSNYTYTPSSVKLTTSTEENKPADKTEGNEAKYLAALEDSDCVDDEAKFSDDENYISEYKPEAPKTVSTENVIESETEDKIEDKFDIVNQIITASKKTDEYLSNRTKIVKAKSETSQSDSVQNKNNSDVQLKSIKTCKHDEKSSEQNVNDHKNNILTDELSNHNEIEKKPIKKIEKNKEKNDQKLEKSSEKTEKKKDKQSSSCNEKNSSHKRHSTSHKEKSNLTITKSSSSSSHKSSKSSVSSSSKKKSSSSSSSNSTEKKSSSSSSSSHSTEKKSSSHSKEKKSSSHSSDKKSSPHKSKDSSKHSSHKHSSSHTKKHSSSSSEKKHSSESKHVRNSKHSSSSNSKISKTSHHKEKHEKIEKTKSLDLFGDESDDSLTTHKKSSKESHLRNSSKTHKLENNSANDSSDVSSDGDMGDLHLEEDEHDDIVNVSPDPNLYINKNDVDELDEHDTYEECLRIFNEYEPHEDEEDMKPKVKKSKFDENAEDNLGYISGKKRIAHNPGSNAPLPRKKTMPPGPGRLSASQVMHNRFIQLQKLKQEQSKNESSAFTNSSAASAGGKKRIAHVPNVSALLSATKNIKSQISSPPQTSESTQIQTNPKGTARVAHIPKLNSLNRPIIPAEYGSKVPVNVRQRYLNLIIDECVKMYEEEEDAFTRALSEEKSSYDRSTNRNVYINVVVNTIKRLRSEVASGVVHEAISKEPESPEDTIAFEKPPSPVMKKKPSGVKPNAKTVSHEFVLGGKKAANTSYSIQRSKNKVSEDLTEAALYKLLQPYLLTKEQLDENGYPRMHPTEHGKAVILKQEKKNICTDPLEKICCRCGARFKISPKGVYLTKEECVYHWGKAWKKRIAGAIDNRYTCCQGDLQSEGCSLAKYHVHDDIDYGNLTGYVKTLPKSPPIDGNCGVFALDCEMCYTTKGCELSRITVIGPNLKPVYETFVKPENAIVDYNTRFSGIKEEDMVGVKTTLRDVQAVLLSKFSDKTILIGHSLESDCKAMKLIHDTVVDTSIVFPHRLGLPYKRALRNLMAEILKKIIQNDVDGHDSQEDALACMELMLWKIKDDLRKLR